MGPASARAARCVAGTWTSRRRSRPRDSFAGLFRSPSPEQVKALALRMAEQRERAAEDPTQDMNRPEPSGDEPLDLSEPEDLGESGPFEERSAPRTKADLLREIRQRADRRTGQQEAEQRQIDPWQVQPPQRRGHGR